MNKRNLTTISNSSLSKQDRRDYLTTLFKLIQNNEIHPSIRNDIQKHLHNSLPRNLIEKSLKMKKTSIQTFFKETLKIDKNTISLPKRFLSHSIEEISGKFLFSPIMRKEGDICIWEFNWFSSFDSENRLGKIQNYLIIHILTISRNKSKNSEGNINYKMYFTAKGNRTNNAWHKYIMRPIDDNKRYYDELDLTYFEAGGYNHSLYRKNNVIDSILLRQANDEAKLKKDISHV